MLEIQKGCNAVVDTCIQLSKVPVFTYSNNLETKGVLISEDALYIVQCVCAQSEWIPMCYLNSLYIQAFKGYNFGSMYTVNVTNFGFTVNSFHF